MKGYLSKISIHINDLLLHANYIGTVVNQYSIIVVYM